MLSATVTRVALALVILGAAGSQVDAQTAAEQTKTVQVETPTEEFAAALVKSTLVAFNDALRTGNYTVLRELGTLRFQATNSSATLFRSNNALSKRTIDFIEIVNLTPKLTGRPRVKNNVLRLFGYMPLKPRRVNFDLSFRFINNRWRLHKLAVAVPPEPEATGP